MSPWSLQDGGVSMPEISWSVERRTYSRRLSPSFSAHFKKQTARDFLQKLGRGSSRSPKAFIGRPRALREVSSAHVAGARPSVELL